MMRFFAAVAGILVASLIVCGLALGWLLLPVLSESGIRQAVERHTARSIAFAGRPRLSLWPELAVELRQVELSNPPGMAEGRFAAADAVRLKVSAASLLRRAPEVTEIVVVGPRINLLVDSEGRSNFPQEADAGDGPDLALPPIVIIDGTVRYLNERSAAAIAVSDVDVTLARSGGEGPIDLDGALNWNEQRLSLAFFAKSAARLAGQGSPADFTIAGPHLSAAFSGRAALKDGIELAGTLQFTAEPLSDLLSWAGQAPVPGLPDLSVSGALDLSGGAIRISKAELAFGAMHAVGDVALELTGPKLHIKAELQVERIDAGLLEAELGQDTLHAVDAELTLAVTEIAYGELVAGPSRLAVKLANGAIDVAVEALELYGGQATGRVAYDGSPPLARIEAKLDAAGVDGGKLSAALTGGERVRGSADVDLDLAAVGASREELVARLKGTAHLRVMSGALVGLDVPATLDHVMTGIAERWTAAGNGETPFSLLEAKFALEDGIAETADLALEGPAVVVAGRGSVDLLRRRLDLKMKPQADGTDDEATAARLAIPVIVAGHWSAPRIYPDVEGILENPAQAFEGLRRRLEASAAKLDLGPAAPPTEPGDAAVTR